MQGSGNGWLLVAANGELCGIRSLERHAVRPLAQAEAWRRVPAKWFRHAGLAADLDSPSALALSGPGEYTGDRIFLANSDSLMFDATRARHAGGNLPRRTLDERTRRVF